MVDTAYKAGTFSWHNPEHTWQAGPGKIACVENNNNIGVYYIFLRGFSFLNSTLPNELSMADKQRSLRNATGLETFLSFSFIFENSTKIHKFL